MGFLSWFIARPARLLGAGAVLAIGILLVRVELLSRARDRAEARARQERLERLNVEARGDTTRLVFQDSLRGVSRLVEQLRVESHARLRARDREATARADLEVRFDSISRLIVTGPAAAVDTADVRSAELVVDSVPFHLRVTVQAPPPPHPTRWDFSAWLDPASLTLELACVSDRAQADLVAPAWLDLRLTRLQQDRRVCAPPLQTSGKGRRLAIGAGIGVGVIHNGSGWQAGPGGFVGVTLRF